MKKNVLLIANSIEPPKTSEVVVIHKWRRRAKLGLTREEVYPTLCSDSPGGVHCPEFQQELSQWESCGSHSISDIYPIKTVKIWEVPSHGQFADWWRGAEEHSTCHPCTPESPRSTAKPWTENLREAPCNLQLFCSNLLVQNIPLYTHDSHNLNLFGKLKEWP